MGRAVLRVDSASKGLDTVLCRRGDSDTERRVQAPPYVLRKSLGSMGQAIARPCRRQRPLPPSLHVAPTRVGGSRHCCKWLPMECRFERTPRSSRVLLSRERSHLLLIECSAPAVMCSASVANGVRLHECCCSNARMRPTVAAPLASVIVHNVQSFLADRTLVIQPRLFSQTNDMSVGRSLRNFYWVSNTAQVLLTKLEQWTLPRPFLVQAHLSIGKENSHA